MRRTLTEAGAAIDRRRRNSCQGPNRTRRRNGAPGRVLYSNPPNKRSCHHPHTQPFLLRPRQNKSPSGSGRLPELWRTDGSRTLLLQPRMLSGSASSRRRRGVGSSRTYGGQWLSSGTRLTSTPTVPARCAATLFPATRDRLPLTTAGRLTGHTYAVGTRPNSYSII